MDRLPIAPLYELTDSTATLAQRVGVSRRTIARDVHAGLTLDKAERYAGALGVHPADVWPEWTDLMIAMVSTACDACGAMFVPYRSNSRFCSRRCYRRFDADEMVRRYWRDPEGHRRRAKEKYEANRERRAEWQREYRARKKAEVSA